MENKISNFLFHSAWLLSGFMVFCIVIFISCEEPDKISGIHAQFAKMEVLKPSDSLVLKIDNESVPYLVNTDIQTFDGVTYLFTMPRKLNLIKKYNMKDGQIISTIDLNLAEPNKLNALMGYQHLSLDTLLCYDQEGILWIIPLNSLDEEMQKINVNKIEPYNKLFFHPTQMPAIRLSQNTFIFANYYAGYFNEKILAVVDFDKQEVELQLNVPSEHVEGYFAHKRFAFWNYVYDDKEQLLYFSFPNLDSIYVYSLDYSLQKKLEFKSKLKEFPNAPLTPGSDPKIPFQEGVNWDEVKKKARLQFFYESILFNKEKDHWYRFTGLPIQDYKIELRDPVESEIRHYTLIVSNSDFEYLEEYSIPFNQYEMENRSYFIHDGKLYIERKLDTEDKIVIDIFDI